MAEYRSGWTDERTGKLIGNLLRFGVLLSAGLVLAGAVVYLIHRGAMAPHYKAFRGESASMRSVSGIVHNALLFRGRGIIELGVLLLISTPVARVALSIFAFAMERDYLYVVVTIAVLAVLAFSLMGGRF